MEKIIHIIFVLLLSSLAMAAPEDDALAFVEATGVGKNLPHMAIMVASNMQTYRTMVKDIGEEKANFLTKKHIQEAVDKYKKQWDRNLAQSYLEFFSAEELNSIVSEKYNSPYFNKFRSKQNEVGTSMQKRSGQLLQNIVSEAMTNAFTESEISNK